MKAMKLELMLRKIANSGDSDIVYGQATALKSVLKTDAKMEALSKLLASCIKSHEKKTGKKLKP